MKHLFNKASHMARSGMEQLESRALFNALTPDVTWGFDGRLTPGDQGVGYIGLSNGGILTASSNGTNQLLRRYNADGTLDASYGSVSLGNGLNVQQSVDVDSTGRLIYGRLNDGENKSITIRRINANGTADAAYGDGATTIISIPRQPETFQFVYLNGIETDSTGAAYVRYTVQTNSFDSNNVSNETFIAKLNSNGDLDTTFADEGQLQTATSDIREMGIDLSNRLLVAERANGNIVIRRYTAAGAVDSTYGTGGAFTTPQGAGAVTYDVFFDSQGRTLLGLQGESPTLRRVTAAGALDSSFGNGGVVTLVADGEFSNVRAVLPQADGKIFVETSYAFVRLNANGSRDTSFDGDGAADYDYLGYGAVLGGYGRVVAQLPDGSYLTNEPGAISGFGVAVQKLALRQAVARGTSGTVYITGSDAADSVTASLLSDRIRVVFNGATTDYTLGRVKALSAGLRGGNDSLNSNLAVGSTVIMGGGNDTLTTGDANDSVDGGDGNDTLTTRGGTDNIDGGAGNNIMSAGSGGGFIVAANGEGDNTLTGTSGAWVVSFRGTGSANITLAGTSANVQITPAQEECVVDLSGITSSVSLFGGSGDDSITTGIGNDIVYGRDGNDTVRTGDGNDFVGGDQESASSSRTNDLYDTGDGNDRVIDGYGNNTVNSGNGDDSIRTGGGADSIVGGIGRDTVRAGSGDDYIDGGGSRDRLFGSDGDDYIMGGGNSDFIYGGLGNDTLIGNQGNDLIIAGNPNGPRSNTFRNVIDGGGGNDVLQRENTDDDRVSIESLFDTVV